MTLKDEVKASQGIDLPVSGGDGCSLEDAIVVHYDKNCTVYWVEERIQDYLYGRYCLDQHLVRQELLSKGGRIYDHYICDCDYRSDIPPGTDLSDLYFDITECWNKVYKER